VTVAIGFVKLFRAEEEKVLQSGGGAPLLGFYSHLLALARWKDGVYEGVPLKRGQLLVTMRTLSKDTKLTVKQVRNFILKLTKLGLIWAQPRAQSYTIINISNIACCEAPDEDEGHSQGHTKGTVGAQLGHSDLLEVPPSLGLMAPKKVRRKEGKNKDPRVQTLGDSISELYLQKTKLTFQPQGQMRKDIKSILQDGKSPEEILAAYQVFLKATEPFLQDRAWSKFRNWFVAHISKGSVQSDQIIGRTR
jgi:hypothetical protein